MKYLLDAPVKGTIASEKFKTTIHWRNGVLITDELEKLGGKDIGPDPYTLLLSSLVACTLATLRMYIERKDWSISEIKLEANMFHKIESQEVVLCIERKVDIPQVLDPEIVKQILHVAENCPVSKMLKGSIHIVTEFKE